MEKKILYKFFDGNASYDEKEAVRIWLESSPKNEEELFREREFFDAVILSGHSHEISGKQKSRSYLLKAMSEIVKIVAIFAIAIACGNYCYKLEMNKNSQTTNMISVPSGQRVNLTLPDGTNVWLNARTKLYYPAIFSENKRQVTLDGEAYFEVAHAANKPFIVQTTKCNIEVLGTKFNVEAYSDSEDFSTALMEGTVKVVSHINPSKAILLSPNNMVSLKSEQLSVSSISDFDVYRWKEGLICFRNMRFEQLMLRFEKFYGVRIFIENKHMQNYICSGKFRISDGIDNALRILQKDAKYTFERNKDESIIYIK